MRIVPTKCVPEDAVLSEALYTDDGRVLVNAGTQLTSKLVERLNQNHIYSVYIKDQHSTGEIERLVNPLLRQKGHNLVKRIFDAATNTKPDGTPVPMPIMGLNSDMICQLFMGGIFHDIGMAMMPKEVLYKKEPLTMEDKRLVLYHPLKGYEYLKDKAFLSAYVRAVTLGHHEHVDGSGYPNRKNGGEIHLLTQIVGIADIYDAMTSDKPYRQALPANEALEYIMSVADKHYSMEIIKAFIRKVNPYPIGSLVKLKDGQTAVVRKVPSEMPLRPLISIIKKKNDGFEYEDVNLMENQTLAIGGIQY